jgi:hypothetical protein
VSQSWMRSRSVRAGGWVIPLLLALVGCGGASAYAPPPGGVTRAESYGGYAAEAESAPMAAPASMSADFESDSVSGALTRPDGAMLAQAAPAAQGAAPVPQGGTAAASTPRAEADDAQRGPLLIYQATLHLSVFEVEATQRSVIAVAQELGGFLARQSDQQVVIRVPAPKFRDALARIEETGDVLHRNVEALDVSEEFRDVQIRLRNAEVVRDRLAALMAQARNVDEALSVQRELERITGVIEQLKGRLQYLGDRIAYSTITVFFQPAATATTDQPDVFRLPFPWLDELSLRSLLNLPYQD